MLTAVAGVIGALVIGAWVVVAWGSRRRQPWLWAPVALFAVALVALDLPGWSFVPLAVLAGGSFAELVVGAREHPTIRTKTPDAPLSTERWAAAVAAPFRVALAEPWDVVARPSLRRRYRRMLERQWGVVDRDSLLAAVDGLLEELRNGPSLDLVVDLKAGLARSRFPDGGADTGAMVRLTSEQVTRLRTVTGVSEGDETVMIGAYQWWKSVHVIRLVCGGATLDWLSPVETQTLLRRVASDLQRRYSSWGRLSSAFHAGYLLWPDRRVEIDEGDADRVWVALGLLDEDPRSPWNLLPWDMPLERVSFEGGVSSGQE
ncbi:MULTISPECIES: DUF1266 domain-containing protein [Nocardiopsis]|uniref:DUF1266 domain-containing protein n=1 Tax=Nocardiopsis alba TaxID=53437 RepID=A0A7K2IXK6_9ACTN|nr:MULTISPECIES: DUF1266 domain-containing protein [Nocardiopsis]MEC3892112.1 DUF1266 domain-containing protein [Nocardiopsis sp. LDBS1602]MYR34515.1 DUF1266 domain-containing protein [Nocardiopsis alba]